MPGISVCPDCALSLVVRLPSENHRGPEEGDEFVTVATFGNLFEASVAKGALEADGLPALVPGEDTGAFGRTGARESWVELKVRASDRDRAVELLKQAGHQ